MIEYMGGNYIIPDEFCKHLLYWHTGEGAEFVRDDIEQKAIEYMEAEEDLSWPDWELLEKLDQPNFLQLYFCIGGEAVWSFVNFIGFEFTNSSPGK